MKRCLFVVAVLSALTSVCSGADSAAPPSRRVVVTVDDMPVALGSRHSPQQRAKIMSDLLAVFDAHGVPAVGFVNESKLFDGDAVDPAKVALLEQWLRAGLELGNHSFSHPSLHRVPVDEWLADVARGEKILRPLIESHGGTLRYFRHPYLHTGLSAEVQAETAQWLGEHGYVVAPVTMDNSEWIYGRAYAGAYNAGDEELMDRIGASYLEYMLQVVDTFESQAQLIVGRPIPHILLIHAYALNADRLGGLLDVMEQGGWRFISLDEALRDPVFSKPIAGYTGRGGITWLHRWALTDGLDRSIFEGEPEVPGWVETIR